MTLRLYRLPFTLCDFQVRPSTLNYDTETLQNTINYTMTGKAEPVEQRQGASTDYYLLYTMAGKAEPVEL